MKNYFTKSDLEHGQIIDFDRWSHQQVNLISLRQNHAKNILKGCGLNIELLDKLRVGQMVVLNHREELNAIVKDTENNFRFIK